MENRQTVFKISGMDCGAEEQLVRAALNGMEEVIHLECSLARRRVTVVHRGPPEPVFAALSELNLGAEQEYSGPAEQQDFRTSPDQTRVLRTVLAINFLFFALEMTAGMFSGSMGLVADSLDMLADAFVYGISLMAVGKSPLRKKRVARTAGYFQVLLAVLGFSEVVRRFLDVKKMPDFAVMIGISILALAANAICLVLLQRAGGREEAHMRASLIFTSNDVIINLGVIAAGVSVKLLESAIPDLVVGSIVFALVMYGALRILKLGR